VYTHLTCVHTHLLMRSMQRVTGAARATAGGSAAHAQHAQLRLGGRTNTYTRAPAHAQRAEALVPHAWLQVVVLPAVTWASVRGGRREKQRFLGQLLRRWGVPEPEAAAAGPA